MKRRWLRRTPDGRQELVSLGIALGAAASVGLASYYLARLFVAREEMEPSRSPGGEVGTEPGRRTRGVPAQVGSGTRAARDERG